MFSLHFFDCLRSINKNALRMGGTSRVCRVDNKWVDCMDPVLYFQKFHRPPTKKKSPSPFSLGGPEKLQCKDVGDGVAWLIRDESNLRAGGGNHGTRWILHLRNVRFFLNLHDKTTWNETSSPQKEIDLFFLIRIFPVHMGDVGVLSGRP